jgi:hypothetical protein
MESLHDLKEPQVIWQSRLAFALRLLPKLVSICAVRRTDDPDPCVRERGKKNYEIATCDGLSQWADYRRRWFRQT